MHDTSLLLIFTVLYLLAYPNLRHDNACHMQLCMSFQICHYTLPSQVRWEKFNGRDFQDCGEHQIKHWLAVQDFLFNDLKEIKHHVVLHMEHFVNGDAQGSAYSCVHELKIYIYIYACVLMHTYMHTDLRTSNIFIKPRVPIFPHHILQAYSTPCSHR